MDARYIVHRVVNLYFFFNLFFGSGTGTLTNGAALVGAYVTCSGWDSCCTDGVLLLCGDIRGGIQRYMARP